MRRPLSQRVEPDGSWASKLFFNLDRPTDRDKNNNKNREFINNLLCRHRRRFCLLLSLASLGARRARSQRLLLRFWIVVFGWANKFATPSRWLPGTRIKLRPPQSALLCSQIRKLEFLFLSGNSWPCKGSLVRRLDSAFQFKWSERPTNDILGLSRTGENLQFQAPDSQTLESRRETMLIIVIIIIGHRKLFSELFVFAGGCLSCRLAPQINCPEGQILKKQKIDQTLTRYSYYHSHYWNIIWPPEGRSARAPFPLSKLLLLPWSGRIDNAMAKLASFLDQR